MNATSKPQSPLRTPASRMTFCDRYFAAVGAALTHQSDSYREYTLPPDVDKEMTDRPYYWMWVENTGQDVAPSTLRLAFTEAAEQRENPQIRTRALAEAGPYLTDLQRQYFVAPKAELVSLGSFRLDKIYASCDQRGRYAAVMPAGATDATNLVPWLMVNIRISHRCDVTEQFIRSYGLCLANGQRVEGFYSLIERIPMQRMNPALVTRKMTISVAEAMTVLQTVLTDQLAAKSHSWATSATERLAKDVAQIDTYYDSLRQELQEEDWKNVLLERVRKIRDIKARSEPRIELAITQIALVGLVENTAVR